MCRSRIGGFESPKARGKDLVGRCPFHGPDDEPSFVVTPSKGLFHCFGCGAKGSVIDFVMQAEGISFRHAAELLRAGVQWSSPAGEPGAVRHSTVRRLECPLDRKTSDAELLDQVVDYYHETLKASSEALVYLEQRGIADSDAINHFRLGYGFLGDSKISRIHLASPRSRPQSDRHPQVPDSRRSTFRWTQGSLKNNFRFSHPICTASSTRTQSRNPQRRPGYVEDFPQSKKPNLWHIWARKPGRYF